MKINKGSYLAIVTIAVFLLATVSSSLKAQEGSQGNQEIEQEYIQKKIELTRASVQADRKAIVNQYMNLTEEESQKFWPLYEEYRSQAVKLDDRFAKLILDYSVNYNNQTVSDEQAEQMLSDYLTLEQEELDLRNNYVTKFQEILPGIKVTRYFQLENKMDAVIDFDLAGNIPLVE